MAGVITYNSNTMDTYFQATDGYHYQRLMDVTAREFMHLFGMN